LVGLVVSVAMGDELPIRACLAFKIQKMYSAVLPFVSATMEGLMELVGDKKPEHHSNP